MRRKYLLIDTTEEIVKGKRFNVIDGIMEGVGYEKIGQEM